jgi:hypothetical protein
VNFKMQKQKTTIKPCRICLGEIETSKESHVKVTDYFKGKFHSEGYYHNKCYLDRINKGMPALLEQARTIIAGSSKLLKDAGYSTDKEFVIK